MSVVMTADSALIKQTCPNCGKAQTLLVSAAGYAAWQAGTLIQDALPELAPAQREVLMTGFCDPCFTAMFAYLEDEDDE